MTRKREPENRHDTGWRAGAASLPFPIPVGTPLGGYAARSGPATGTLDELAIGALVLEQGGARFVLVAADVVAVDAALVDEVAQAAGIERRELALCASHTHSGPAGVVARLHPADPDRLDPDLRNRFVATAAAAISAARDRIAEVDLLFGQARAEGVAANRNDPGGPHDSTLSVLAARRGNGSLQVVVVHFACHPTILGAGNRRVSADFPGALRRALATEVGGPVILYVNGAAGDVSTRFTRRAQDAAEVERMGTVLARAARMALDRASPLRGAIRNGQTTVSLPSRRLDEGVVAIPAGITTATKVSAATEAEGRILETKAQGVAMLAALADLRDGAIPTELCVDGWLLGDVALAAIPGELFAALGREIEGDGPAMVPGYTNGYVGYLVDRAAYVAETYEALASPYAPGAGEAVAEEARALLRRLREMPHGS